MENGTPTRAKGIVSAKFKMENGTPTRANGIPLSYYYVDDVSVVDCTNDGVQELSKVSDFKLSPNPNNGEMQLNYQLQDNETGYVEILNVLSEKVSDYRLTKDTHTLNISEKQLNNGVYFYQVFINDKKVHTGKIVINK